MEDAAQAAPLLDTRKLAIIYERGMQGGAMRRRNAMQEYDL